MYYVVPIVPKRNRGKASSRQFGVWPRRSIATYWYWPGWARRLNLNDPCVHVGRLATDYFKLRKSLPLCRPRSRGVRETRSLWCLRARRRNPLPDPCPSLIFECRYPFGSFKSHFPTLTSPTFPHFSALQIDQFADHSWVPGLKVVSWLTEDINIFVSKW